MSVPLISIVTAFYNRLPQFLFTLRTIERSAVKAKVEVIVVDDGSVPRHVIGPDNLKDFSFPIKVLRIDPKKKTWINPVIPFNLAISQAQGQWIILQNPEVCHIGDICSFVANKASKDIYHVLPVWAIGQGASLKDYRGVIVGKHGDPYAMAKTRLGTKGWPGRWYATASQPRRAYHFCAALHRSQLDKVGGFNPAMGKGIWYDDDEFLVRVRRAVRKVAFVDSKHKVMGLHQWHPTFTVNGKPVLRATHKGLKAPNLAAYNATRANRKKVFCDRSRGLPPPTSYTSLEHIPFDGSK